MTPTEDVKPQGEIPAYNVELRILLMAQWITKGRNDWKQLEQATGIKAVKWRHAQAGVTRPSLDMFEALCKLYPQHAFWLATGIADNDTGHTAPQVNLAFPGGFGTVLADKPLDTENYYRSCLSALDTVWTALVQHFNRTKAENGDEGSRDPRTREELVAAFQIGINTSIQLSANETYWALGKERQRELLDHLYRARWDHFAETAQRLRDNLGFDEVIDEQRAREKEQLAESLPKDKL